MSELNLLQTSSLSLHHQILVLHKTLSISHYQSNFIYLGAINVQWFTITHYKWEHKYSFQHYTSYQKAQVFFQLVWAIFPLLCQRILICHTKTIKRREFHKIACFCEFDTNGYLDIFFLWSLWFCIGMIPNKRTTYHKFVD